MHSAPHPTPSHRRFQPVASLWPWLLLASVTLTGLLATVVWAPMAVTVVFLLTMGAVALGMIRLIAVAGPGTAPSASTMATGVPDQFWTDWLDGWYWQTDAQGVVVVFKPPAGAPATHWHLAAELTAGRRVLWELVDGMPKEQLRQQLLAQGGVEVPELPWPFESVWSQGRRAEAVSSRCVGVPRRDAQGQCLGHHGVWQVLEPAPVARVEPETAAVDEATEAAQASLRYALSHDLRAPIRVVDGFARILKEDYASSLDRMGRDHVERILSAAQRMNGMIDAVLDQASLSKAPLQLAPVDFSALAQDIANELVTCRAPRADGTPLPDVRVEIAPGMQGSADEALVRRLFENLIGNALKYSQKVASPQLTVGVVPATNPVVYFVKDNGAGFDMKHADKLFGLFQRLHSAREFPGTGVGLASVNNIVRRHGGQVWAESAPGEGACFYFTLNPFSGQVVTASAQSTKA